MSVSFRKPNNSKFNKINLCFNFSIQLTFFLSAKKSNSTISINTKHSSGITQNHIESILFLILSERGEMLWDLIILVLLEEGDMVESFSKFHYLDFHRKMQLLKRKTRQGLDNPISIFRHEPIYNYCSFSKIRMVMMWLM